VSVAESSIGTKTFRKQRAKRNMYFVKLERMDQRTREYRQELEGKKTIWMARTEQQAQGNIKKNDTNKKRPNSLSTETSGLALHC
jgi:hypothetical protein